MEFNSEGLGLPTSAMEDGSQSAHGDHLETQEDEAHLPNYYEKCSENPWASSYRRICAILAAIFSSVRGNRYLSRITFQNPFSRDVDKDPIARKLSKRHTIQRAITFKQQREDNRKLRLHTGGIAWGFDPSAGLRQSSPDDPNEGCYISSGIFSLSDDQPGELEHDDVGRSTGRRWYPSSHWGIERGGPGVAGNSGYGAVIKLERLQSHIHLQTENLKRGLVEQLDRPSGPYSEKGKRREDVIAKETCDV